MTIRVTVKPSYLTAGRVRIEAVNDKGYAEVIVENILRGDATGERNRLLDELSSGGQYDEVTGDAIQPVNNQISNKAQK